MFILYKVSSLFSPGNGQLDFQTEILCKPVFSYVSYVLAQFDVIVKDTHHKLQTSQNDPPLLPCVLLTILRLCNDCLITNEVIIDHQERSANS